MFNSTDFTFKFGQIVEIRIGYWIQYYQELHTYKLTTVNYSFYIKKQM